MPKDQNINEGDDADNVTGGEMDQADIEHNNMADDENDPMDQ